MSHQVSSRHALIVVDLRRIFHHYLVLFGTMFHVHTAGLGLCPHDDEPEFAS